MNSQVVRLYNPPKPTLLDPDAQIKWIFFQIEAEYKEPRAAGFRYAKNKYLQFVAETNAGYLELATNRRFYLSKYWEVDALVRFNGWLTTQQLTSKTRYSLYKSVRQTMDMAYALRIIDAIVYHAPMFKGVSETKERAAYSQREQEIVNAALGKWIDLAQAVVRGYTPTGEGIPYRLRDFSTTVSISGQNYLVSDAARVFGVKHGLITMRLKLGWTPGQAVGVEPAPTQSALNWTFNGQSFKTVVQVAKAFNLSEGLISYRIRKGWSFEQIIGAEPPPSRDFSKMTGKPKEIVVEGKVFKSLKAAAEWYGVGCTALTQRLANNWTLLQALGLEERQAQGIKLVVEGITYPSISEAARVFNVGKHSITAWLRRGFTPEQAVGIVPKQVAKKDERALLWMFENEFACDAFRMVSHFRARPEARVATEKRLMKLFIKWGVWAHVDDRLVMPLAVEMAKLTGLNVESLKELEVDSYQLAHALTGQSVITYLKRRSGSATRSEDKELHIDALEVEELYIDASIAERVRKLVTLILAVTAKIRPYAAGDIARRLFIFEDVERSRKESGRVIVAIDPAGKAGHWYRRFCGDEGLYEVFGRRFNFNISRCRPTLVTNMILAGADLFQVQVALGHESARTTATYLDEKQLRPAFNKSVSEALEGISRRSKVIQLQSSETQKNSCQVKQESGFHETLSGCGCINPYSPSEDVRKVTNYVAGTVCKYWNMCLLCDSSVVTENSLPKLLLYQSRLNIALESDAVAIRARKELYIDAVKLINGIVEPGIIFPCEVIDNAKYVAATMDDLLVDHLIYQGL